ncbi:MAG: hypothetical protein ACRD1T_05585, partial [Acidimicrobiia bacterium]
PALVDNLSVQDSLSALVDLRKLRRRRRIVRIDRFEAFYRVYLTGIFTAILVFMASGRSETQRLSGEQVALFENYSAVVFGFIFVLACVGGMRSGAAGGPLAIESAEARYVLEAPIDRGRTLRGPALRKLRYGVFVGAVAGAAAGIIGYRRLPGNLSVWIASLALFGSLVSLGWNSLAMLFSGRRYGQWVANGVGTVLIGLSAVDFFSGSRVAPGTQVGRIATWPLGFDPVGLMGLTAVMCLAVLGLWVVGGTSLEAAQRRSRLISGLRYSTLIGDVRMVVLTRRQLAHETVRPNPWVRLRPAENNRFTVWKRDWHGFLRWPLLRIARHLLFGIGIGIALTFAWAGSVAMLFVAGGTLYLAALDAIEPLGQETDHRTFADSFPRNEVDVFLRHLPASTVAMLPAALVAGGLAAAKGGLDVSVALAMAMSSALSATLGVTVSVTRNEPPLVAALRSPIQLEFMGPRVVTSLAIPPAIATAGLLPLMVARADPRAAMGVAALICISLIGLSLGVATYWRSSRRTHR